MIGVLGYRGLLGSTICRLHRNVVQIPFITKASFEGMLRNSKLEVLINCLGVVPNSHRSDQMFQTNSELPRWLFETCTKYGVRLVHVSTDCVFDGKDGMYVESDKPNATTDYGISKAGGEIIFYPHLVVRTSFVGLPDTAGRGLLAWLVEHTGKTVPGFSAALWNGLTVDVLADILVDIAPRPRIWGIRHICNTHHTISKYHLLKLVSKEYELDCTVVPAATPRINRTLSTMCDDIPGLYDTDLGVSYPKMIHRMHERLGNAI